MPGSKAKAQDKKAAKKVRSQDQSEGRLLRYLRRSGTRKGFMGDSKPWLYIGAASWAFRFLRKLAQRKPEILLLEELKPGQRIIISSDRPTVDVS